ncbi:MAG: hypothetical protein EHM77_07570, partial [Planctomycetaceae bacterium]
SGCRIMTKPPSGSAKTRCATAIPANRTTTAPPSS